MILVPWSDYIDRLWMASPYADVDEWLESFNGIYEPDAMGADGYVGAVGFEDYADAVVFKLKAGL